MILAVPAVTPVITPEALTVATAVLLLLHVPPASPLLLYVVVPAIQIVEGVPLTVPGLAFGLTVTDFDAVKFEPQPVTV